MAGGCVYRDFSDMFNYLRGNFHNDTNIYYFCELYCRMPRFKHTYCGVKASNQDSLTAEAQGHCCTYHQVQQWLSKKKNSLEWGWKKFDEHLRPITTARPAAPEELLSLIVCACKNECIRNCECRKSSLNCSSICDNCSGLGYDNRGTNIIDEDLEEEGAMFEEN